MKMALNGDGETGKAALERAMKMSLMNVLQLQMEKEEQTEKVAAVGWNSFILECEIWLYIHSFHSAFEILHLFIISNC